MAGYPVYSTRFISVAGFTGEAAFECPGGYVLVCRCIDTVVYTGAGYTLQAGIGGSSNFWAVTTGVVAVSQWSGWRGRQVVNPGEQLVLASDAAADMVASGYLLSTE